MYYNILQILIILVLSVVFLVNASDILKSIFLIPVITLVSLIGHFNGNPGYSIFFMIISMNFVLMTFSLIMTTENRFNGKVKNISGRFANITVFLICLFCGYFLSDILSLVMGVIKSTPLENDKLHFVLKDGMFPLFLIVAVMSFVVLYLLKAYRGDR